MEEVGVGLKGLAGWAKSITITFSLIPLVPIYAYASSFVGGRDL